MQVFTFCKGNYAKSTGGARAALSELERHEFVAAVTSERTRKSVGEHIWVLTRIDRGFIFNVSLACCTDAMQS